MIDDELCAYISDTAEEEKVFDINVYIPGVGVTQSDYHFFKPEPSIIPRCDLSNVDMGPLL